ncbi:MAG: response regulator transcription factor [Clostridiales bacterium]|jgi:DNA-binding response OmpR family regulator|nr:response regulator transcription factor [Clostridiales bacterium]
MNKILVVDDDANIRRLVCRILTDAGFEVCEAGDGGDALERFYDDKISACVVDIMMPNMDGFEFCRNIRSDCQDIPLLMLTAKTDISQKKAGFGAGADDYLTKPFDAEELLLRVKALLKRYKIVSAQALTVGALTIDSESRTVTANGVRSDIPMKEFEVLFKLAGAPGKTFSRNQLIEDIWGYDFEGTERTVDVHINRLRERFPPEQYGFRLTAVRSLGYRLEVGP